LAEAAHRGEVFVARLRLILVLIVSVIPLTAYLARPVVQNRVGVLIAASALVLATLLFLAVRKGLFPSGIGVASSLLDVTLVSAALLTFVELGMPSIAVNSRIIYPIYFLAIMATSLRYDSRVCLLSGACAIVEYGAIALAARARWTPGGDIVASYGSFDGADQAGRLVLLAIATTISALTVIRSRQLLLLSTRDILTGLFNRGFFDERLQEEVERARRLDRPVTLAMLDLDHFKDFNDGQGHRAGDELLKIVARSLRDFFRSADTVARYGGDEFAIIVADSAAEEVAARLDDFRRNVEFLMIPLPEMVGPHGVTVSIGAASWPRDGRTAEDVLIRADKRLYEAKRQGGNAVVSPPAIVNTRRETGAVERPS
jgi:diguanylate cyclase (GGDEF)-like protein